MFEPAVALASLADLSGVGKGLAGPRSFVGVGAAHPFLHRHRVNPEITNVLVDSHSGLTVPGAPDDDLAQLRGLGLRHNSLLPDPPCQAIPIRCRLLRQHTLPDP